MSDERIWTELEIAQREYIKEADTTIAALRAELARAKVCGTCFNFGSKIIRRDDNPAEPYCDEIDASGKACGKWRVI